MKLTDTAFQYTENALNAADKFKSNPTEKIISLFLLLFYIKAYDIFQLLQTCKFIFKSLYDMII